MEKGLKGLQQTAVEYDEGLLTYFTNLKRCKPLKKDEERKLLVDYKTKNDIVAKQKLITSNLRYACSLVNKYKDYGVPLSDLIEEANCGLIEGIEKFDLEKDVRVITYAKWTIEYYLQKAVKNKLKAKECDLPNDYQEYRMQNAPNTTERDIILDYNNDDDDFGFNRKTVDISTNDSTPSMDIESVISVLNQKEEDFIKMYYGLPPYNDEHTYQDIGKKYNISKERVRQIIDKIMRKLRTQALIILNK